MTLETTPTLVAVATFTINISFERNGIIGDGFSPSPATIFCIKLTVMFTDSRISGKSPTLATTWPDKLSAVKPFLFNLFNDPAIIGAPSFIRYFLAKLISSKREKTAKEIYSFIGGRSPILEETKEQKKQLENLLKTEKDDYKVFISMRYWKPFVNETVTKIMKWQPDEIILLPLYPQFSTTTSGSSLHSLSLIHI